jgi:RNA polymerase sigma-70 factor (ECF subfamily)
MANDERKRAHLSLVTEGPRSGPSSESAVDAVPDAAPLPPLLPRVAQGDEAAVREFVARYGSLIWSLVRRWSPDLTDAEDAVQETFVELWRSAARYDAERATEPGWVAMVTRRRLIDRLRRRQRAIALEPLPDNYDQAEDYEPDLDRDARIETARDILRALPAAQRQMLELSLLHGRTHDEIATVTGTPLGTVKSHIRRGLQRARALLAASGKTYEEQD